MLVEVFLQSCSVSVLGTIFLPHGIDGYSFFHLEVVLMLWFVLWTLLLAAACFSIAVVFYCLQIFLDLTLMLQPFLFFSDFFARDFNVGSFITFIFAFSIQFLVSVVINTCRFIVFS